MKLSIMLFPFHGSLSQGHISPEALIAELKSAGATGIEPMWSWMRQEPKLWQRLHQASKEADLACACYDVGVNLIGESPGDREQAVATCMEQIAFARDVLACPSMMIHGTRPAKDMSNEEGRRLYGKSLAKIAAVAKGSGLCICIENFGVYPHFTASARHCREVLDIAGPELGFTFDNGNFLLGGDVPTAIFADLKDRIRHVHIKDMRAVADDEKPANVAADGTGYRGCYLGEGDARVKECIALLKQEGYQGWISAEINSSSHEEARHALQLIRQTWQNEIT
jgi:L-ribulose-5-phosphate 3-epimerase